MPLTAAIRADGIGHYSNWMQRAAMIQGASVIDAQLRTTAAMSGTAAASPMQVAAKVLPN